MDSCRNCEAPVNGNYCSNCGQPARPKRIDKHYIIQEIGDTLFAHKGMIYTIKKVLITPGESVRQYITEDRRRFVKPITFVIITSLIYAFVSHFFRIDSKEFYQSQPGEEFPTVHLFINWMLYNHGYVSIISGLFVAFWVKLLFRKSGYNLFEIFVLLCFISGISALLSSVFFIVQGLTHTNLIRILILIVTIYSVWAIGQFFDKRKATSYIKAFISYSLGYFIIGTLIAVVAIFIDIVIK